MQVKNIMEEKDYFTKPVYYHPAMDVKGFNALANLALDMRWSWNHAADEIWKKIDPDLWEILHNPWILLHTVSKQKIESALASPDTQRSIDNLIAAIKQVADRPAWFQETYPNSNITYIAYFCMEFMLGESLPIYSGGLGNVAGDQLKAASDLGVPVIGVGLLYQQGYFRQLIDKEGRQQAFFPSNNFWQLPIIPLRDSDGEWLRLQLNFTGGFSIWIRVWQVKVDRVKLYLLDTNDEANLPPYRGITNELYGGDQNTRFLQELVLGIGGWRLLQTLGMEPEVCHLNEGHAAFAVLERARSFMIKTGQPFEVALAVTRVGNLFTTHTAVDAGFDRFDIALLKQYMADYCEQQLGIPFHDLLALGCVDPNNKDEKFNMAYLAIRSSGAVNGVSLLHGKVSRHLFANLFPHWPVDEIPIKSVTNGVHVPTWDSKEADQVWTMSCGKSRWRETTENLEIQVRKISDAEIWQFRRASSKALIEFIRKKLALDLAMSGFEKETIEEAKQILNPAALTIGFARRFATYKRPDLLLHDPERLLRIISNPERPVQIILAGKAHPADIPGQALIQKWVRFISQPEVRPHIVFLSDYDMLLTEQLAQGVDVWLNTPRRPWEACGTSGMKVLVNGGLNLSELDGWWAEAYTPEVGWALGDGQEHGDDPAWDAKEAEELYDILENEVIPKFYNRNSDNIPTAWVAMMRESMARLTPYFSTNRTVREYVEKHYLPAATAYLKRATSNGIIGKEIIHWQRMLDQKWSTLRFGELKIVTFSQKHTFTIEIFFGDLDPSCVRVELYADGIDNSEPLRVEMTRLATTADSPGYLVYSIAIPAERPANDYTVRVIPYNPQLMVPLEESHILWQR